VRQFVSRRVIAQVEDEDAVLADAPEAVVRVRLNRSPSKCIDEIGTPRRLELKSTGYRQDELVERMGVGRRLVGVGAHRSGECCGVGGHTISITRFTHDVVRPTLEH